MRFFLTTFLICVTVEINAQSQNSPIGTVGIDIDSIKATFARSKGVYMYAKYKLYAKPSHLIKAPLNALHRGAGVGGGVMVTDQWRIGLSFNLLPYSPYQISQMLIETDLEVFSFLLKKRSFSWHLGLAMGPIHIKEHQSIKLSTRTSLILKYKVHKHISVFADGEINLGHYSNTKFLTYLAASLGVSYHIDLGKKRSRHVSVNVINENNLRLLIPKYPKPVELLTSPSIKHTERAIGKILEKPSPTFSFSSYEKEHVHIQTQASSRFRETAILEIKKMFRNPIQGSKVISQYRGARANHRGIDLKRSKNDTIRAALDGQVRLAKYYSSYGNVIVIRHIDGLETLYSHNSQHFVKSGDVVKRGDPIAITGSTGRASTEHLHFEIRVNGKYVDPSLFYNFEEDKHIANRLHISISFSDEILIQHFK